MKLNTIKPARGARGTRMRVGRGIGSGKGKTSGRGHKGQKSRPGGFHKVGFEGGQMPLQRRLPKRGFLAPESDRSVQVRLGELAAVSGDAIDLATLKSAGLVPVQAKKVKVFLSGKVARALTLRGIQVTKGAKAAIEAAGGRIEA